MRRRWVFILLGACFVFTGFSAGICLGGQNRGGAEMELDGGKTGPVPFPHERHQLTLGDCRICHSSFAQKAGAIGEMKSGGQLKKKQVMNKLCIQCHKQKKKAGEKTGPTSCRKCHIK